MLLTLELIQVATQVRSGRLYCVSPWIRCQSAHHSGWLHHTLVHVGVLWCHDLRLILDLFHC
jgi:hypothetical protein